MENTHFSNLLTPQQYPSLPPPVGQPYSSLPPAVAQQYNSFPPPTQQYSSFSSPPTQQFEPINPQMFQQEIREGIQFQQPFVQSYENRGRNRNFQRGRGRTRFGIIICGYCGKKGHVMYNCRFLFGNPNQNQNYNQGGQNRNRQYNPNSNSQTQNQNQYTGRFPGQFPARRSNNNRGQPPEN